MANNSIFIEKKDSKLKGRNLDNYSHISWYISHVVQYLLLFVTSFLRVVFLTWL